MIFIIFREQKYCINGPTMLVKLRRIGCYVKFLKVKDMRAIAQGYFNIRFKKNIPQSEVQAQLMQMIVANPRQLD